MTIKECIDIVDNIKPNQYSMKEKVMWLSFVDETIINDVLKTHEGYDSKYDNFEGYTEDKLSVSLIVGSPYDRLYTAYLKMKIDQENGETARYNNSAALYNTYMMEFRRYYNKTHMPIDVTKKMNVAKNPRPSVGLSDAEYENIVRDLTYKLTEYFSNTISHDKMYAVVNEFVQNNIHILRVSPEEIEKALIQYLEKNPIKIDIPEWAMQKDKPTYTAEEVGAYGKKYVDNELEAVNKTVVSHNSSIFFMEKLISSIQEQINTESHFRGYLATNADIQALKATPNDFAYSAQSGTVWVYKDGITGWQDTGKGVPDQLTPASESTPLPNGEASKGQENAYARGDHVHPSDVTKVDKTEFDEFVDEVESKETILYEDVVSTPEWTIQPTYVGSPKAEFSADDFYYVTLNDANGNKLSDGKFMLKSSIDTSATVYSTVFYLSNLNTGEGTLVENYPVEFANLSDGGALTMRDAGVWNAEYVLPTLWDLSGNRGSLKIVTFGQFIKRDNSAYFISSFKSDKNVSHYHSYGASSFQSDSTKQSTLYAPLGNYNYKTNKFYDECLIERFGNGCFATKRNVTLLYIPFGKIDYTAVGYNLLGHGTILGEGTSIKSTNIQVVGSSTKGMIRNGSVIRVTEVK